MIDEICLRADDNFSPGYTWLRMTVVLFNVKTRVERVIHITNRRIRDLINEFKPYPDWPGNISGLLGD